MGMTAENVCTNETYQKKYGYSPITREMLDEFSYNSRSIMFTWAASFRLVWARTSLVRLP